MLKARHNAVYNSRVPKMFISYLRSRRGVCPCLLVFFSLHFSAARVWAADWSGPEQQLASKIASVTGPGAVALDVANRSSINKKESDEIAHGLRARLSALGVQYAKPEQAAASVQVSLSENLQNYIWVAEIHQGAGESSVVMISFPRPAGGTVGDQSPAPTIRRTPLWSQDERILDVVSLDVNVKPLHLIVLTPEQLGIYRFQDGRWQQDQTLPITHSRPWPRDIRGRLVLSKEHLFDVYLPGTFCQSTAAVPLSLSCRDSDDPWPLGNEQVTLSGFFAPRRNFFTGVLVPGIGKQATAPSFYSAAPLPREKYALWLLAAVSGQVHALDGMTDQTVTRLGWGSDIASVRTTCGSGWQVLATQSGSASTESVRAYEFPDRDPVPMTQPLEFNGSITALWTESSGSTAIAISRNSEMGGYEAFRLAIACGQ